MTSHDNFAESLAAYSLDALDRDERAAFEAHLAGCRHCQDELADFRRVTVGIGMAVKAEEPPASLRSRVLSRATGEVAPTATRLPDSGTVARGMASRVPWLIAAASLVIAVAAGIYASSLRAELQSLRDLAADATARVDTLRTELMRLRQDATRLQQVVNVINAPDVRQARLAGFESAQAASGLALWSPGTGLVVNAKRLPPIEPGRGYELWVIVGGKPISVGMLTVSPDGTASHAAPLPPTLNVDQVAVSIEQAGGSPTGQPHGAIVLLGKLAG